MAHVGLGELAQKSDEKKPGFVFRAVGVLCGSCRFSNFMVPVLLHWVSVWIQLLVGVWGNEVYGVMRCMG